MTANIGPINFSTRLKLPPLYDDNQNLYYLTLSNLYAEILKHKNDYIHTDNDGDYFIEVRGNTIYIYFEETDSWCDWVSNFDFLSTVVSNTVTGATETYGKTETPWKCHRGFWRVWNSMRDAIEETVLKIIEGRKFLYENNQCGEKLLITNIVCGGYSHGAAICGLCVEDMEYLFAQKYGINVYGYGFGCPRFTWGRLPDDVKYRLRNFYAIRNDNDLVTHAPPAIFGYTHGCNKIIKIKPEIKYGLIKAHYRSAYTKELQNFHSALIHEEK